MFLLSLLSGDEDMDKDLLLVTKRGFIKRIQLKEFGNVKKYWNHSDRTQRRG